MEQKKKEPPRDSKKSAVTPKSKQNQEENPPVDDLPKETEIELKVGSPYRQISRPLLNGEGQFPRANHCLGLGKFLFVAEKRSSLTRGDQSREKNEVGFSRLLGTDSVGRVSSSATRPDRNWSPASLSLDININSSYAAGKTMITNHQLFGTVITGSAVSS